VQLRGSGSDRQRSGHARRFVMPTETRHFPYYAAVLDCPVAYQMIAYASLDGETWIEQGVDSWWQDPLVPYNSPEPVDIGRERFDWSVPGDGWGRVYWAEMRTGVVPGEGTLLWRFDASERTGTEAYFTDPRGRQWLLYRHGEWADEGIPDSGVIVGTGAAAYLDTQLGWVSTPDFGAQPSQFVVSVYVGEVLEKMDVYVKSGYRSPTRGWEMCFLRRDLETAAMVGGVSKDGHGTVENWLSFSNLIEVEIPPEPPPPPTVYNDVCTFENKLGSYITYDPPAVHWCQLGSPVVTCESYAVGTSGVREEPLFPATGKECQMTTIIDLVAAIARECSFEGNEDGTTNPDQVEAVSAEQDADLAALLAWAEGLPRPPLSVSTVQFISEGGLAITMLTTSAYAGWS
jgi:hypothetical protein